MDRYLVIPPLVEELLCISATMASRFKEIDSELVVKMDSGQALNQSVSVSDAQ